MGLLRQRYAVVSDQSWELARAGYLSGLSARVACERFGMGEHNLRKRARRRMAVGPRHEGRAHGSHRA